MLNSRHLYAENYYTEMNNVEQRLRESTILSPYLLPIPVAYLYSEIIKRHQKNNKIFSEELKRS